MSLEISGTRLEESDSGMKQEVTQAYGHWTVQLSQEAYSRCSSSCPLYRHGEDSLFLLNNTGGDGIEFTSSRHVVDSESSITRTIYFRGQHLEAQFTSTPTKHAFD